MKIEIQRIQTPFHLRATNESGNHLDTDASPSIGGTGQGMRPMELLLAGIGSCSSIDVIDILRKQRQALEDIQIIVDGEREADKVPSLFSKIHLHFILKGNLDEEKVKKALDLSITKYCSVAKTLEKTAEITYSFEINP